MKKISNHLEKKQEKILYDNDRFHQKERKRISQMKETKSKTKKNDTNMIHKRRKKL